MARAAIFALIPVVALLVWRDVVLERQLATLAYAPQPRASDELPKQLTAREAALDMRSRMS